MLAQGRFVPLLEAHPEPIGLCEPTETTEIVLLGTNEYIVGDGQIGVDLDEQLAVAEILAPADRQDKDRRCDDQDREQHQRQQAIPNGPSDRLQKACEQRGGHGPEGSGLRRTAGQPPGGLLS